MSVFGSVFYVEFGAGLICVANGGVEPGPLTLLVDTPEATDWRRFGLVAGQPARLDASSLRVAGLIDVEHASAMRWLPPPIPEITLIRLSRGLSRLRQCLPEGLGAQGLGGFLQPDYVPPDNHRDGRAAAAAIAEARQWEAQVLQVPVDQGPNGSPWATHLSGLGAGLTPAGDDFLGGMMIALHAIGAADASRCLWSTLSPACRRTTNVISYALLAAASQGHGGAGLHRALNAIIGDGAELEPALADLARIGHTSGWDALAGLVTVMEAVVGTHRQRAA